MPGPATFHQVLDAADRLSLDEQHELIEVLRRRLAQLGRERVAMEASQAQVEHRAGQSRTVSVEELMREIGQ
jgi:hypothetical protein